MFPREIRIKPVLAMLLLAPIVAGCGDCKLDTAVSASITCESVLGGEYLACHGPAWEEATQNWCSKADLYLMKFAKPYPGGGHIVIEEHSVPFNEARTRALFIFERKIVRENTATREICFHAVDPPICYVSEQET